MIMYIDNLTNRNQSIGVWYPFNIMNDIVDKFFYIDNNNIILSQCKI